MIRFYRRCFILLLLALSVSTSFAQANPLRTSPCRFDVPRRIDIDCMTLRVPENRSDPNTVNIVLSLAILRHPDGNPEPDPIIFLQGGPGGISLDNLSLTYPNRFEPLFMTNRDIIVFDQRGIGDSRPSLDCNTYRRAETDLLDFRLDESILSKFEIDSYLSDLLISCGELLSTLHDLEGYNSRENAGDIEAIRQALGYEQVNLWGISYGTKLALTAMRDYPNSFRRVVLDSVYPLEANLYTELPINFERSLSLLFERCQADRACHQTYPDLESILYTAVDDLNRRPIRFDAPNPYNNGVFEDIVFDGDVLLRTIFQLLYSTDLLARLPQLIYQASERNTDTWSILLGWIIAQRGSIAVGMNYAVQCHEELAFTQAGEIMSAWDSYPQFESYSATFDNRQEWTIICEAFNAGQATEYENQPVTSDIPTLILSGEYDPITPPSWAQQVDDSLSNSYYVALPNSGHGVSGSVGCGQSIVIEFFSIENISTLDSACTDDLPMIFSGTQDGDFNPPRSTYNFGSIAINLP
ncbi:MAG: alpha/beta fold hydrolase [Phototrophicaceae bacterium]